jgi:hypothetical protein
MLELGEGVDGMIRRMRRVTFGLQAAIFFCVPFGAQSAPAYPGPDAAAQEVWNRVLTHCGESYWYVGSVFDQSGMLGSLAASNDPPPYEFRGARFNTVPIPVSDADKLNGVGYRGRITMLAHVFRKFGESWQDGPNLPVRNMNDTMSEAFQEVSGDSGEMGIGGVFAFDLVDFNGKWLVERSSTISSGPVSFGARYYEIDRLQGSGTPKEKCDRLGTHIQSDLASARARIDAQTRVAADAKTKAALEHKAREEKWKLIRDPVKGVPFLEVTPDEFSEIKRLYAERDIAVPGLSDARERAWQNLDAKFPRHPTDADWLPPGTSFDIPCDASTPNYCGIYMWNLFVIVSLTGERSGHYAVIDIRNTRHSSEIQTLCAPNPATKCN